MGIGESVYRGSNILKTWNCAYPINEVLFNDFWIWNCYTLTATISKDYSIWVFQHF